MPLTSMTKNNPINIFVYEKQEGRNQYQTSIFDFNPKISKEKSSRHKYYVVNNHYPRKTEHQRRPTAMANSFIFPEHLTIAVFVYNNYASIKKLKKYVYQGRFICHNSQSNRS